MLTWGCVCCEGQHTHKSLVTKHILLQNQSSYLSDCVCCYLWRCIVITYLLHTTNSPCNSRDTYPKQKQKFLLFLLKHMQIQMEFHSMIDNRKICIWIFHSVISDDTPSTIGRFNNLLRWLGRQFRSNTLQQTYAIKANLKLKPRKINKKLKEELVTPILFLAIVHLHILQFFYKFTSRRNSPWSAIFTPISLKINDLNDQDKTQ